MRICVIGAGAMGGSFAALLDRAGHQVDVVDTWAEHVAAINADGLYMHGALGEHTAKVPASTVPTVTAFADWVIVFTDSNNTVQAAETVASVLAPSAVSLPCKTASGTLKLCASASGPNA